MSTSKYVDHARSIASDIANGKLEFPLSPISPRLATDGVANLAERLGRATGCRATFGLREVGAVRSSPKVSATLATDVANLAERLGRATGCRETFGLREVGAVRCSPKVSATLATDVANLAERLGCATGYRETFGLREVDAV